MSCVLYLVRHAIAGPAATGMSDSDRTLSPDGKRKMRRIATGLKRLGVAPDAILSSPLRRAHETAEIVLPKVTRQQRVEIYPPLAPGHGPDEVVKGLRPHRVARELMLVGHEPDMGRLASYLLTRSATLIPLPFKKGGVAAIGVDTIPPRKAGVLLWFVTPRQLRMLSISRKPR